MVRNKLARKSSVENPARFAALDSAAASREIVGCDSQRRPRPYDRAN